MLLNNNTKGTYRFAVVFDIHYCLERDEPMSAGCAEVNDKPRYSWMRTALFPELLAALQNHSPDLVVCTGDICEGGRAEPALQRRELEEVFTHFAHANLALLNTKGTHEPKQFYAEIALPHFTALLGKETTENYYALDTPGGRLVILDYLGLQPGTVQADWLDEQCRSTPEHTPLFVFAHAPLVNFARPFFSYEPMQEVLRNVFAKRTPTVFFCGHTHNQAFTFHRRAYGSFVQIKGSSVGFPDRQGEPLENRHVLLLGEGDTFYWGVPEDVLPGYWILDVTGQVIIASWYGIGRGLLGQARLSVSGQEPVVVKQPVFDSSRLRIADLPLIERAWLEVFMSGDDKGDFEFCLNGVSLGTMPSNTCYAARRSLVLTKEALGSLGKRNNLEVKRGTASSWILGGARLAARTFDGRWLTSPIPPYLLASGEYADRAAGDSRFTVVSGEEPVRIRLEVDEG